MGNNNGRPKNKKHESEFEPTRVVRAAPKPPEHGPSRPKGPAPTPMGNTINRRIFTARPPVRGKASMKELTSRSFNRADLQDPFGPMAVIAQNEGWGQQGGIGFHCYNCRNQLLPPQDAAAQVPHLLRCTKCMKVNASLVAARIAPTPTGDSKWFQFTTGDNTCRWVRVLSEVEEEGLRHELEELNAKEADELETILEKLGVTVDDLMSSFADAITEELAQFVTVYRLWDPLNRPEDGFIREKMRKGNIFWSRVGKYRADPSEWRDVRIEATTLVEVSAMPLEQRLAWFRNQLDSLRYEDPYEGPMRVFVHRSSLLEDASNWIAALKDTDKWRTCRYEFVGEPAMDSGGVAKEWYRLVCDTCFQPDYGLFERMDLEDITYTFNPLSGVFNPERHLYYFRFAGRILAKAIFEGCFVEAHLSKVIYKHIVGRPCSLDDLKYIDSNLHSSMISILEDPDAVEDLFLDFTASSGLEGEEGTVPLKEGGENIAVTKDNLGEYIKLYIKYVMYDRTSLQLNTFLMGFHEIIPQALLSVFNHDEFETIMCGVSQINLDDWKANVTYRGEFKEPGEDHQVIAWFWDVLEEMTMEDRSKLLQYITGSSRVPMSGFAGFDDGNSMLISIESIFVTESVFPRAHTCFNRLELPTYETKEELELRVREAMQVQNGFNLE